MTSSTQQYSPADILVFGQRAEAEGKLQYAAQFYHHLRNYYAGTQEGNEAAQGLARIEHMRAQQPAAQPDGGSSDAQAGTLTQAFRRQDQARPAPAQAAQRSPQPSGQPQTGQQQARSAEPAHTATHAGAPARSGGAFQPARAGGGLPTTQDQANEHEALRAEPVAMPRHVARAAAEHDEYDYDDYDDDFHPKYRLGSALATGLAVIGWLVIAGGLALAILGVIGPFPMLSAGMVAGVPLGIAVGVGAIVVGFALVFISQLSHAVIDNANANRQRLALERSRGD